ncbi:TraR/DksA family transcriptional regulator [Phaeovulum sp.]|uniref:TraR/DksA family transcriptional regulator n=1 Tax=Phaeovulum sp. TaxID=2934796 RepID=UPI0027300853|nr:TraR/DksA C4-type zinc finger protein [Phaeovulum sp.]MDP1668333.1 TraR/DksA C4-type zinc finger protein [Phaeovulum sp.]MDP2062617.1 TraR/DksA C4-type zinc finger protein [Phaeovulum sp.]MDP3861158.1 TraR/DksA C4-type zinc finger protein [Phaeovulum sp.]MDZ4118181.1 TraR/DksA C4-type zinc finger protein [Phaeovulum sp.]
MKSVAKRKTQLLTRLAHLQSRISTIGDELLSHDSRDWEELAIERADEQVLEDLGQSAQSEIRMLEAALKRIEAGEYGSCAYCGEPISEARLDTLPATPFCRNHARAADRH